MNHRLVIGISNPLPAALAHYERELGQTIERAGAAGISTSAAAVEGLRGSIGRLRMLRRAFTNAAAERRSPNPTLATWTSLGLLEPRIWGSRYAPRGVILHDPIPLRRQVGFDRLSKKIARFPSPRGPIVISHSLDALQVARTLLPAHRHVQVSHPILSEQTLGEKTPNPTLAVAGQFKPQRDLRVLAEIGPRLKKMGVECRIYGRGWPEVPGWQVDSRFLSEAELDDALGSSWAVLLPYRLYFQSGIAVRALEVGTLTVSPPTSFAREIASVDAIVREPADTSSWLQAVEWSLANARTAVTQFEAFQSTADASWGKFLNLFANDDSSK